MTVFADRNVLITGAAGGIGLLMAQKIAARGARLILWDMNPEALEKVRRDFAAQGVTCRTHVVDVTDRVEVYTKAELVLAESGAVDVLVNNAGVVSGKLLLEIPDEKIERTMAVNALSLFWTTKAFLPAMIGQQRGHIVTIASAAGLVGTARQTDYAASKHAAVGFDEALRCELRHLGHSKILTTVVCPFYIATGMFEGVKSGSLLLPIIEPDVAANRIVNAIEKGHRRLFMPRLVRFTYLMRLLPTAVFDFSMRVLGVARSMDEFKGR